MSDNVNHPAHYNQLPVECIDVIEGLELNFALGSALKYIWRHGQKGGIVALKKAAWYRQREIERQENGK